MFRRYQANTFILATCEKQELIVVFVKHQLFDVPPLFRDDETELEYSDCSPRASFTHLNSIAPLICCGATLNSEHLLSWRR